MRKQWFEHATTALIIILVTLSFILTGYLWRNTPSSEIKKQSAESPPYISQDTTYNHREKYEFIGPYQIILHHHKTVSAVYPESPAYRSLLKTSHQLLLDEARIISPGKRDWARLFQSNPGIEFILSRDTPLQQVEAFLGQTIALPPNSPKTGPISRVWIYSDPKTYNLSVWLISDDKHQVIHIDTKNNGRTLEKQLNQFHKVNSTVPLTVFPTGTLSRESQTEQSFSRTFYLPIHPLPMDQIRFTTHNIPIEHIKQWLLQDPGTQAVGLNQDESFFMYNDQILTYNHRNHIMIYNDTSNMDTNESTLIYQQLDQIQSFIRRHQGWTGIYLLDEIHDETFSFRLFKNGHPVFWKKTDPHQVIHPDLIQLQTSNTLVNKYTRSMFYLSKTSQKVKTKYLLNQHQFLRRLTQQKIPLHTITQIYPGYVASETWINKKRHIVLDPVWVLTQTNGNRVWIASHSSKK